MKLKKSLAVVLTSAALFSMCTGTMVEASRTGAEKSEGQQNQNLITKGEKLDFFNYKYQNSDSLNLLNDLFKKVEKGAFSLELFEHMLEEIKIILDGYEKENRIYGCKGDPNVLTVLNGNKNKIEEYAQQIRQRENIFPIYNSSSVIDGKEFYLEKANTDKPPEEFTAKGDQLQINCNDLKNYSAAKIEGDVKHLIVINPVTTGTVEKFLNDVISKKHVEKVTFSNLNDVSDLDFEIANCDELKELEIECKMDRLKVANCPKLEKINCDEYIETVEIVNCNNSSINFAKEVDDITIKDCKNLDITFSDKINDTTIEDMTIEDSEGITILVPTDAAKKMLEDIIDCDDVMISVRAMPKEEKPNCAGTFSKDPFNAQINPQRMLVLQMESNDSNNNNLNGSNIVMFQKEQVKQDSIKGGIGDELNTYDRVDLLVSRDLENTFTVNYNSNIDDIRTRLIETDTQNPIDPIDPESIGSTANTNGITLHSENNANSVRRRMAEVPNIANDRVAMPDVLLPAVDSASQGCPFSCALL